MQVGDGLDLPRMRRLLAPGAVLVLRRRGRPSEAKEAHFDCMRKATKDLLKEKIRELLQMDDIILLALL